ncbi:MAG: PEP-CTERM sorting domain-containing protein [Sedimentisphaerales bacterium]|nr:PEP-CTERM sorting domain-containing protein [Sedimentisphaerales bacterium]
MSQKGKSHLLSLVTLTVLTVLSTAYADSTFLVAQPGYQSSDILTSQSVAGYDVQGDNVIAWINDYVNGGSLKLMNTSGTVISDLGTPAGYDYGWNNFVRLDPSGDSVWVGMSVDGNTDDRIYQVDLATQSWAYKATMAGNFEMEFSGGNAYVTGLNSTSWLDPTSIWLLDTSGSNDHDCIAAIGGYSAGFAFDSAGNVYYATNGLADNALISFSAAQVAAAVGASSMDINDATILSDLLGGGYDTTVDEADNVICNANYSGSDTEPESHYVAMWNGNVGSGTNYDVLATAQGPWGDWISLIDSQGNVTVDGSIYQADFYYNGIAELSAVPEPITVTLLLLGSGMLIRKRRL